MTAQPAATVRPAALEAVEVTKAYGATLALDRVSFQALAGKVNVILGENGAGKSTLMKILAGEEAPDSGRILCDGRPAQIRSPRDAHHHGIAIIHQELSLFPALSVADNIFAGRERHRAGVIDERSQSERARALLQRLDVAIDPDSKVSTLAVGQRQVIEIAKALARDVRVLIMDEPTSALSNPEVAALFRVIRELAAQGVAIIYISHRMDEIFRIGDLLTVFRDGRRVAAAAAADVDLDWVFDAMLGSAQRRSLRAFETERAHGSPQTPGPVPALKVERLTLADPNARRLLLDEVSFTLWPGEVLGVYGLLGAGKTELAEVIAGYRPEVRGEVRRAAAVVARGIRRRMQAGIVLVPEDRQRDALVRMASVADNILLSSFAAVSCGGIVLSRRAEKVVADMVATLGIRVGRIAQPVVSLSGGNQQKTIIARALLTLPSVLLLDEPTRGIDIGAKAEVFQIVRRLAHRGLAVLYASSELPEVMAVSDRILVLSRGRVQGLFDRRDVTEADIVQASTGGSEAVPEAQA